jgi:hypothetical protein
MKYFGGPFLLYNYVYNLPNIHYKAHFRSLGISSTLLTSCFLISCTT